MALKKLLKKTARKLSGKEDDCTTCEPIYNEFGTCIACQGGKTECLHNNLAEGPQGLHCTVCGVSVN